MKIGTAEYKVRFIRYMTDEKLQSFSKFVANEFCSHDTLDDDFKRGTIILCHINDEFLARAVDKSSTPQPEWY